MLAQERLAQVTQLSGAFSRFKSHIVAVHQRLHGASLHIVVVLAPRAGLWHTTDFLLRNNEFFLGKTVLSKNEPDAVNAALAVLNTQKPLRVSDFKFYPRQHNAECLERREAQLRYDKLWPQAHRECQGTGIVIKAGDRVPYGSTTAQLPDESDVCSCAEKGRCPRCGSQIIWHDEPDAAHKRRKWTGGYFDPCPECGLVSQEVAAGAMRPEVECYCKED